ncbi:hypothetical protein ACH5RR_035684 [Cinchona calisaya]|uniref:At1g61320/AtMIF1 LRR domain-containing protein n=1 Tax=Cinchona calisaya TaxID=153742 RepID=A0ABD2Y5Z8_9GENT
MTKVLFKGVVPDQISSLTLGPGEYCQHMVTTRFTQLPFPISQLQMLSLDLCDVICNIPFMFPDEGFPQLTNLRRLELSFLLSSDQQTMLFVCSFLRASPALHKLVLKYQIDRFGNAQSTVDNPQIWGDEIAFGERHQQMVNDYGCKYDLLEEVEFLGWNGLKCDYELVTHLIEAAGSLERVIDARHPFNVGRSEVLRLSRTRVTATENARNRARDLEAKLSPTTTLVVLEIGYV